MRNSADSGRFQGGAFARLEIIAGSNQGRRYALVSRVTVIGRESYCDVLLDDAFVSRHHAQIEFDGRELWLTDLASTNGTYVNDTRLSTPYRLRDGDRIIMGNSILVMSVGAVEHVTIPPPTSEQEAISEEDPMTMPVVIDLPEEEKITPVESLPVVAPPPADVGREIIRDGIPPGDIDSTVPLVTSNTFRLRIFSGEGGTSLVVQEASRSLVETPFEAPLSDEEWSAFRRQMVVASASPLYEIATLHKRAGQQLYAALLPAGPDAATDIHGAFVLAAGEKHGQEPLILQLWFDSDVAMAAKWPWELLYDGANHPVLDDTLRLNRHIVYFGKRERFEPVGEVRALLVAPRPTDQEELAHYAGRDVMTQAFGAQMRIDGLHVSVLETPSFSRLKARLVEAKSIGEPYHIVHFDGHGSYFKNYDASVLCFEDSNTRTQLVPAPKFASVLEDVGVRLVLVSAALSGGAGVGNDMLAAVGPALIRAGGAAVVVMQSAMSIDSVSAFAIGFYDSLVRGESASAAVAQGRSAIVKDNSAPAMWFAPALYLRVADGRGYLFSEEPKDHRMARRVEMTYLAAIWSQMSPEQQADHEEGPLKIVGL